MAKLGSPSTMCGPFCSVPAVPMIAVVVPAFTRSRTSAQVSSSRNTVSGGLPLAAVAGALAGRCADTVDAARRRRARSFFTRRFYKRARAIRLERRREADCAWTVTSNGWAVSPVGVDFAREKLPIVARVDAHGHGLPRQTERPPGCPIDGEREGARVADAQHHTVSRGHGLALAGIHQPRDRPLAVHGRLHPARTFGVHFDGQAS